MQRAFESSKKIPNFCLYLGAKIFAKKYFFIQVFLSTILTLAESYGQGGPSTFGYDGGSACTKPISRTARIRAELPCDFEKDNWCSIAGNSYPW